ncbi:MAG: hypothetical protein Ct9H90mP2_08560 [Dehalococcoidia bacterium]|nr:MAG: hypothetical protein Ct9H90mP2_08560 [Dehalococcoidia bacterium]
MDQKSDYKLNINKLMTLTNFEYEKSKSNPPGFHLERVEYMMKKFDYPNKNQVFIHVAGSKGKGSTQILYQMLSVILKLDFLVLLICIN